MQLKAILVTALVSLASAAPLASWGPESQEGKDNWNAPGPAADYRGRPAGQNWGPPTREGEAGHVGKRCVPSWFEQDWCEGACYARNLDPWDAKVNEHDCIASCKQEYGC